MNTEKSLNIVSPFAQYSASHFYDYIVSFSRLYVVGPHSLSLNGKQHSIYSSKYLLLCVSPTSMQIMTKHILNTIVNMSF